MSLKGWLDSRKSHFLKTSQPRGGGGGSGEVGMVSYILPVFSFESFPRATRLRPSRTPSTGQDSNYLTNGFKVFKNVIHLMKMYDIMFR